MSNFKINDEVRTNENVPVIFTGHVVAVTPAGQIQVRNSRGDVGTFDAASLEPADSPLEEQDMYEEDESDETVIAWKRSLGE